MTSIHVHNLRQGYVHVVRTVLEQGTLVRPRGALTVEVEAAQIVVEDPLDVLPTGVGRRVAVRFALVEALQLIGQCTRPELTQAINPNVAQFMDGGEFYGAYGPRVNWVSAVERLREDPDSRQAVGLIWRPEDAFAETRDLPCTVALQWLIRDGRLDAFTYMRSNDVWWGLAYDAFQFTQLQVTLANVLGVKPGIYVHNATSLHLYERDWENARALIVNTDYGHGRMDGYPHGFPSDGNVDDVLRVSRQVLANTYHGRNEEINWWQNRLHAKS